MKKKKGKEKKSINTERAKFVWLESLGKTCRSEIPIQHKSNDGSLYYCRVSHR